MVRENLKKIIKLRSQWKIDKRKGNYKLPSGEYLSEYVFNLAITQMYVDKLGIAENGNLYFLDETNYTIYPPFREEEVTSYDEQCDRVLKLVYEMIE